MEEKRAKTKNEEKKMSLKEKVLKLKELVAIMQKNKDGYGYKYVTEDSILLAINDKMIELGVKLTPSFKPGTLYSETVTYLDKRGKQQTDILIRSEMTFIWEDIYSGEQEKIDWIMMGQQSDGSQALGSGLTYANRYFLLKYFNVATSAEDPDKIRSDMEAKALEDEKKKISAKQTKIKKVYSNLIQKYQSQNKVYEVLGTTKEQFLKDFNSEEKMDRLLEQMELLLKEDSNA